MPCPDPIEDEIFLPNDDASKCEKYVDAQSNSITEDVDLVLMTFGGNEFGFFDAIINCFVVGLLNPWLNVSKPCSDTLGGIENKLAGSWYKNKLVKILLEICEIIDGGGHGCISGSFGLGQC